MTTFTLQDLNTSNINNLPNTPEEDEAMRELFEKMGRDLANQEVAHQQEQQARLDAVPPQPSGENPHNSQVSPEAVIDEMLFTIKQSLLLLATVISQSKAQPDTTPPEGDQPSLQETVELVFKQSDWFKDMIKDEVESRVESEVEMYFERRFSPEDHFDFNDAVSNEVADRLDDVVRDRIDEAVEEQLEEVVSNKLQNLRVVFD